MRGGVWVDPSLCPKWLFYRAAEALSPSAIAACAGPSTSVLLVHCVDCVDCVDCGSSPSIGPRWAKLRHRAEDDCQTLCVRCRAPLRERWQNGHRGNQRAMVLAMARRQLMLLLLLLLLLLKGIHSIASRLSPGLCDLPMGCRARTLAIDIEPFRTPTRLRQREPR